MENREVRYGDIELRKKDDGSEDRTVRGYAAVFNKDSEDFGFFIERIAPGAFDGRLSDDVVALFNHDPNLPLARSGAGLKLGVDEVGLFYEFEAPDTTVGNDLLKNVRAGIIKQSSFAFTVKEDKWEERKGKPALRTITKFERLYDVSPVTTPAYPDTTVAARSLKSINKQSTIRLRSKEVELSRLKSNTSK
jgi:uncharacterized protein